MTGDVAGARATRAEAELKTLRERVARIDGLQRYEDEGMSEDKFWAATLYDAVENDEYTHHCPWDAVSEYLDNAMAENTVAELKRVCPVEVVAYKHAFPPHREIGFLAEILVDNALEDLGDDVYANPHEDLISMKGCWQLREEFTTSIMRAIRDHGRLWHCEEVARHSFTFDEIFEQFGPECEDYKEPIP